MSPVKWILFVMAVVASALAWLYLAPQRVGGPVAYVIISGNSMEPRLKAGDLVLVREEPSYEVGEVVAYDSEDLGQIVLHRIVDRAGAAYVFKGDNNGFMDPERPVLSQLIGMEWVHVPYAGRILEPLRVPRNAALLAGALVLVGLAGSGAGRRRKRRGSHRRGRSRPARRRRRRREIVTMHGQSESWRQTGQGTSIPRWSGHRAISAAGILAALLVLLILVGLVSMTRDAERMVGERIEYSHSGGFSYSADAPEGPLYTDLVETGDPVFLKAIEEVEVRFDYELNAPASDVRGSYQLAAVLSDELGWNRIIPLQERTVFEGPTFSAHATLDLARVRSLIARVQSITGIQEDTYSLDVEPQVRVEGAVAGQETEDAFSPRMSFELQLLALRYIDDSGGTNALEPNESEDVTVPRIEPNRFALGPLDLPIATMRSMALVGIPVVLVPLLILCFLVLRAMKQGEAARIHLRHGDLIVPIRTAPVEAGPVLEVEDFESLIKIAEQTERFILHLRGAGLDEYFVEDGGSWYRYKTYERSEQEPGGGSQEEVERERPGAADHSEPAWGGSPPPPEDLGGG